MVGPVVKPQSNFIYSYKIKNNYKKLGIFIIKKNFNILFFIFDIVKK